MTNCETSFQNAKISLAFLRRSSLVLVAAGLASATGSISGPIAGYAANASRTQIRAILGVPGAFGFSDPLSLPAGVAQVRLAPGQDFALVERGDDTPGILFLKDGAVDRVAPVDGVMVAADWVAFSPGAGSALLFSSSRNRLQVLAGLPDNPKVIADLDAASFSEQPTLGAVSDDGALVLVASETSVYRVSNDGVTHLALSAGRIQSMTVLRNGTDAAVSDSATGSVHLLQNAGTAPVSRALASGLEGIGAIFPAWDGHSLFAARPGAEAMSSIDLESGAVESYPSGAAPAELIPLRNHDTFLISARQHQPGWVFYRDGAAGRVVFIPAVRVSRETPAREGIR